MAGVSGAQQAEVIRGRVSNESGAPIAASIVVARGPDRLMRQATADASGRLMWCSNRVPATTWLPCRIPECDPLGVGYSARRCRRSSWQASRSSLIWPGWSRSRCGRRAGSAQGTPPTPRCVRRAVRRNARSIDRYVGPRLRVFVGALERRKCTECYWTGTEPTGFGGWHGNYGQAVADPFALGLSSYGFWFLYCAAEERARGGSS